MAETNGTPPDPAAGYCLQWDDAKLAAIEAEWDDAEPSEPAPPIANVALAVELAEGLDADREYSYHGSVYLFRPTPYGIGLRLVAWSQQLGRLEAMAKLLAPDELWAWEHLPELRDCYREILDLAGQVVIHEGPNPLAEAEAPEVYRLVQFLLEYGSEVQPVEQRRASGGGATQRRFDAAHYLYAYLAHFGAIPGMVTLERGRPCPASWRHYQRGLAYLQRVEAEQALLRAATSMGADDKTLTALKQQAGLE